MVIDRSRKKFELHEESRYGVVLYSNGSETSKHAKKYLQEMNFLFREVYIDSGHIVYKGENIVLPAIQLQNPFPKYENDLSVILPYPNESEALFKSFDGFILHRDEVNFAE